MTPQMIEQAIARGDWASARLWLQKWGYGMVGPNVPQAEKDDFKRLMTEFARCDPAYHATMKIVVPQVEAQPGMMQSDLTRGLPEEQQEALRYVLYFAAELGDLVRVKKGRSYRLYLPGQAIDG